MALFMPNRKRGFSGLAASPRRKNSAGPDAGDILPLPSRGAEATKKGCVRMKKLEITIHPEKLIKAKYMLCKLGVRNMAISGVKDSECQRGQRKVCCGASIDEPRIVSMIKLEFSVRDDELDYMLSMLQQVVDTGQIGDSEICVMPADDIMCLQAGGCG